MKNLLSIVIDNLENIVTENHQHHKFNFLCSQLPTINEFQHDRYYGVTGEMFRNLDQIRDNPVIGSKQRAMKVLCYS